MTSSGQPHVLYIAFPFPPSRGAGVYRVVATINHLIDAGWQVTVIAPEEDYFRRIQGTEDRSLMTWVDSSARVVRVPLVNWLGETTVRNMPLARVLSPRLFRRQVVRVNRYLSPLDNYPFWLLPALRAAARAARRTRPDVVLATGNPFNSFVVAALVGKRFGIPHVLDYRDAWTFDQFTGDTKPKADDVALPLERRLLHNAAAVISVNQAILDWLSTRHRVPGNVQRIVIPNGYDRRFVDRAAPEARSGETYKYVHVGTLVPGKMDWPRVLKQFARTAGQLEAKVQLDIYGHLGFSQRQQSDLGHLFDSLPAVTYRGPVPRDEVKSVYGGADVLYLPLYDSPFVTSGKVYEMMATGKPILAWGSDGAGALEPLRGYPKLIRADPGRPSTLTRAMTAANDLSRLISSDLETRTEEYVAQYSRENALAPLGPLLRGVIKSRWTEFGGTGPRGHTGRC